MTDAQALPASAARRWGPMKNPAEGGVVGRVFFGLRSVFSGFGVVLSDARLFGLSLIPMAIHLLLLITLLWAGFTYAAGPLIDLLGPSAKEAAAAGTAVAETSFMADVGSSIWAAAVNVLVGAFVVAIGLMLSLLLGSVVCDPFYDLISERTEALHLGRDVGDPFNVGVIVQGIIRELVATLIRLAVYAIVAVPLWLLSFTPAAVVATPVAMVWTWLFVAYEFLSRSLARHAVDPSKRMRPFFSHKALFLGFGALGWLLSFVPFTAPLLVAGGTRLYLGLAAWDQVPSRLSDADKALLRG